MTDQLTYARFQLGDGRAADGTRLLQAASLAEMRTARAPGLAVSITANAEVDGSGVGWALERLDGVQIVTHNGTTPGQMALLVLVPEHAFAVAIFTNANPLGGRLHYDVSTWALQQFLGLSTSLPSTYDLPPERLTEYVGRYGVQADVPGGGGGAQFVTIEADGGGLRVTRFEGAALDQPLSEFEQVGPSSHLAFFRDDAALVRSDDQTVLGADFVRDSAGTIGWFRQSKRILPRLA
jgi:hypothetical protein